MKLWPHNQKAYEAAMGMMEARRMACIIQPCGTGKAMIGFHLATQHPKARILWLGPNDYVFGEQNANLKREDRSARLDNVEQLTFAAAMRKARTGTLDVDADFIILDEFHHCGAPEWSKGVEAVLAQCPHAKILGLTATEIRFSDGGRNMADELFEGNVASHMTLSSAWLEGILPIPKFISALYEAPKELGFMRERVELVKEPEFQGQLAKKYEELRRAIAEADGLDVVFERHLSTRSGKLIVFCPNREKLEDFYLLRRDWFKHINPEIHAYKTFQANPQGEKEYDAFKADDSTALKVLYCINQLNEGVHIDGIDGVIMVRPTSSPVIFQQQLGRALEVNKGRTPLVFDLVNNLESMGGVKGLGNELESEYRSYSGKGIKTPYRPRDFIVFDETRDPRTLMIEINEILSPPQWSVDKKISYLEKLYVLRGEGEQSLLLQETKQPRWRKGNISASLRNLWRAGLLTNDQKKRLESIKFSVAPHPFSGGKQRPVICYETGKTYGSLLDAAEAVGRTSGAIIGAIKHKGKCAGCYWYYADEEPPDPETFTKRGRSVVCFETGEVYESVREATNAIGKHGHGLSEAIKSGGACGGFHWYYADEDPPNPETFTKHQKRSVICQETGRIYASLSEAAEAVGRSASAIRLALKSKGKCAGCHWCYADEEQS